MTHIDSEIRINAPREKVWDILADFGRVVNYNPNISDSHSTSKNSGGSGATRHCDVLPMGSVEERITDWKEGEGYGIEIFDGKKVAPFKHALGHLKVRGEGNQTVASISFDYQLKYGPVGWLMNGLVVKSQFKKALPSLLEGLKFYAETGQQATREALKQAHAPA